MHLQKIPGFFAVASLQFRTFARRRPAVFLLSPADKEGKENNGSRMRNLLHVSMTTKLLKDNYGDFLYLWQ